MIQRLQSIFYLLTGGVFFSEFGLAFATSNNANSKFFEDYVYNINDHILLLVLTCLGGAIALVNIFLFKKRALQIRLGYLLIVLAVLLPVLAAVLMLTGGEATAPGEDITEQAGLFVPVLAVIFAFLGNRYTKKDHALVQSMDRLR